MNENVQLGTTSSSKPSHGLDLGLQRDALDEEFDMDFNMLDDEDDRVVVSAYTKDDDLNGHGQHSRVYADVCNSEEIDCRKQDQAILEGKEGLWNVGQCAFQQYRPPVMDKVSENDNILGTSVEIEAPETSQVSIKIDSQDFMGACSHSFQPRDATSSKGSVGHRDSLGFNKNPFARPSMGTSIALTRQCNVDSVAEDCNSRPITSIGDRIAMVMNEIGKNTERHGCSYPRQTERLDHQQKRSIDKVENISKEKIGSVSRVAAAARAPFESSCENSENVFLPFSAEKNDIRSCLINEGDALPRTQQHDAHRAAHDHGEYSNLNEDMQDASLPGLNVVQKDQVTITGVTSFGTKSERPMEISQPSSQRLQHLVDSTDKRTLSTIEGNAAPTEHLLTKTFLNRLENSNETAKNPKHKAWWERFPDYVPVLVLDTMGKNPRDNTIVHFNYSLQFSGKPKCVNTKGTSKDRSAHKSSLSLSPHSTKAFGKPLSLCSSNEQTF